MRAWDKPYAQRFAENEAHSVRKFAKKTEAKNLNTIQRMAAKLQELGFDFNDPEVRKEFGVFKNQLKNVIK